MGVVATCIKGPRTHERVVFDRLLDALFHAMAWSIQRRTAVTVTIGGQCLCTVVDARLYRSNHELSVEEIVARARPLGAAA